MGRIYEYDGCHNHEGYIDHEKADGTWSGGGHDHECGSNGWFRAACSCGWVGSAEHYQRFEDACWLPESEEDRLLDDWEVHMRPLVAVGKVYDADERHRNAADELRDAVNHARVNGASWTDIGRALAVTKQAAQQRFG